MEEALRARLLGSAGLVAIVERRVDWGIRTQAAPMPAVTLNIITRSATLHMQGPDGWDRARVQLDTWGRTFKAARDIRRLVADPRVGLLTAWRGDQSGYRLRTFVLSHRSLDDSDAQGPVFRQSVDVLVWSTPLE